jgi:4-hydroxy 2-oxovalerate aldolase
MSEALETRSIITPKNIVSLDCTFRDGGYYTNWEFDCALASQYLYLCGQIGINIVELGYIRFEKNSAGTFGDLPDRIPSELSDQLPLIPHLHFAAMIDAKEFNMHAYKKIGVALNKRLASSILPIHLLRIAVHFSQSSKLINYIENLQEYGYDICVNLMQVDLASSEQITECLSNLNKIHNLSAVYLADSLGGMRPEKVQTLVKTFYKHLNCPIGFHAHDNIGLALHNSLVAMSEGATWIDSTFYGMGRGSGNVKTEQILPLLRPEISLDKQYELYCFIARYFHSIQKHFGWGTNIFYAIAGINQIHPTYIQQLETDKLLSVEKKLQVLSFLTAAKAATFSTHLLENAIQEATQYA